MSPTDTDGPTGPFLEAVAAATLTATAILYAGFWLDRAEIAAPPLPILILFTPVATALAARWRRL